MKSLPAYLSGKVHFPLPKQLHDEDDYRSCATGNELAEPSTNYSCTTSHMSDSTVEDYLKYNCDDNYLPDEHVDNSKINMIELAN